MESKNNRSFYRIVFVFFGWVYFMVTACNENNSTGEKQIYNDTVNAQKKLLAMKQNKLQPGTITINFKQILIDVFVPHKKWIGDILVLPGYNFNRASWCKNSDLQKLADEKGYRLIMPEMGMSVYASQIFPETNDEFKKQITLSYLCDSVIPFLQTTCQLLLPDAKNYILGLSTGARGVAVICLHMPNLFTCAAALSGDYDQTNMPTDNLMTKAYGSFEKNKKRWTEIDNPVFSSAKFRTPIYLGCGLQDKVVPPQQTKLFYDALQRNNPALHVVLHEDKNAGHDYVYWNSELKNVFGFFETETR